MYITIIKNIFSEIAWPIIAKFYVEPPWEVGKQVYINGTGHMTNMAAMLIYGKHFQKKFSYRTKCRMIMKLCMEQYVLMLYNVLINGDRELTSS